MNPAPMSPIRAAGLALASAMGWSLVVAGFRAGSAGPSRAAPRRAGRSGLPAGGKEAAGGAADPRGGPARSRSAEYRAPGRARYDAGRQVPPRIPGGSTSFGGRRSRDPDNEGGGEDGRERAGERRRDGGGGARLINGPEPAPASVEETGVAFSDGRYVPVEEARISVLDWGFARSDTTYDVVHVWKGRFFRLEDHLDRFERSCRLMRLDPGLEREAVREVLMECVRRSGASRRLRQARLHPRPAGAGVAGPANLPQHVLRLRGALHLDLSSGAPGAGNSPHPLPDPPASPPRASIRPRRTSIGGTSTAASTRPGSGAATPSPSPTSTATCRRGPASTSSGCGTGG